MIFFRRSHTLFPWPDAEMINEASFTDRETELYCHQRQQIILDNSKLNASHLLLAAIALIAIVLLNSLT